tara:strand:- start:52 stop:921 length:870 start_codon:yes stop_codon:yes gene_type:complete
LALAVTILEASIIVTLMLVGGEGASSYARDTLFSAVMLILNGILGISMIVGVRKYKEQTFQTKSVTIALVALVAIVVFTLILPNVTTSISGPSYSKPQLIFVTIACLVIYISFIMAQTVRQRHYFLTNSDEHSNTYVSKKEALISLVFLLACLGAVVYLSKKISPLIELSISEANLPKALVGVVISFIILLPEGISAIRAASKNKFQSSINLSLGSAIASIGLSIPTVAILCVWLDIPLVLGIDKKSMVLLALSLFTVMLSLNKGKTNLTYGTVLVMILFAYIYTIIYP